MNVNPPKRRYTEQEKEILVKVLGDFSAAKTSRQNNCYWDITSTGEANESAGSGNGDWVERTDLQEKMYTMWFEKPSRDEFESNVKSPMASGRIESIIQKLRKINLELIVRPEDSDDPKDKRKARAIQVAINSLFKRKNFKSRMMTWWKDALIHPNAFLQIYYLRKTRKVKMLPMSSKELSDEQKKELLKDKKKRQYVDREIVEYDDVAIEPVKFHEIYVDPSARYLHGESYEAQYIIRRMLPSFSQFHSMFDDDPDAKNVNLVRPGSAYTEDDQEFFRPPQDVENDDYVELLHYYNKAEDRYVVIANDVVVKDMPLPYNHKQLPFVSISTFEYPHQFYHISIPDKLLALQTEEETLKNLVYDRLNITANPMLKVKRTVYGEFSRAYQIAEPGKMLPVNNLDDVAPLDYPTMTFDMFRAIDLVDRDAAIATQIDPTQMGLSQKYVSATASMVNKELTDAFINGLIDSWTESMAIMGYQIICLMKQFYTKPQKDDLTGGEKYRRIRLEEFEINPDTMEVIDKPAGEYSYFEFGKEMFELGGDFDVTVAPESAEVVSAAIEMQKSQANLAQLAPFMIDPSDQQKVSQHPSPWVNGPKTLQYYFEKNKIPTDLLNVLQEDDDIAVERAEKQGKLLIRNQDVAGIPGEPDVHKKVHVKQLTEQNRKVEELVQQVGQLGPMADVYMGMLPITQDIEREKEIAQKMAMHLSVDDMPKYLMEESAGQKTMQLTQPPQQPQVPMPPGLTETGGNTPPIPAGGNQMAGMMGEPQMGGPSGRSGRPVMAAQGGGPI